MNYEPGTVAIATFRGESNVRVTRYDDGWARADDPDDIIGDDWNLGGREVVTDIRPLVVLDPEGHPEGGGNFNPAHFRAYAAGLRETWRGQGSIAAKELEFIADQIGQQTKPAKPAEPQNRYAVVLDAQGAEWVRDRVGGWCLNGITGNHWRRYADIDAVKVLSEGVND